MKTILSLNHIFKNSFRFAKIKASIEKVKRPLPALINDNLIFNGKNYQMYMIPKHPKLQSAKQRSMVINVNSIVLNLTFIKKSNNQQSLEQLWQDGEEFQFKFHHIAKILDITPGQNQQHTVASYFDTQSQTHKISIKIKDDINSKRISFIKNTQTQHIDNLADKHKAQFQQSIAYDDFLILQEILKESLFDMSGLRLILDLKRHQQLSQVKKSVKQTKGKVEEASEFYGQISRKK